VCGFYNGKDSTSTTSIAKGQPDDPLLLTVATAAVDSPSSASKHLDEVLGRRRKLPRGAAEVSSRSISAAGKPDLRFSRLRGVWGRAGRAAVVEDALAGVEAGRRGGFRLVVGVDRTGHRVELLAAGAAGVVEDLGEVTVGTAPRAVRDLPDALSSRNEIRELIHGRTPMLFLDYDGTMAPIVERPEDALLPETVRTAVERLASRCHVAVISGRDLDDVRRMVGIDGIFYAGSHGFDCAGPGGFAEQHAVEFVPELDRAEVELRSLLSTTERSPSARPRRGARSPGGRTERARRGGGGRPRRPRTPSAPQEHREEGRAVRTWSGQRRACFD
jgi:hypothetical protein